ncbi:unnamed protein product [Cylindrotheca closterium]|uniref:Peptidylprolyl isomerase n=1 Tax=Cylindrotheca closterium TaxID=2856 RepID=A0AAD2CL28_9STRA|nr:unnamed protein product [Cylindrotheca closterium]
MTRQSMPMSSLLSSVLFPLLLSQESTADNLLYIDFDDHFEPPMEENVEVYQACIGDTNGFGGSAADNTLTIQYYQEITYSIDGDDSPAQIVRDLDLATVDYLLASRRISCVRPSPPAVIATATDENNNRKLQPQLRRKPVGLSANPDDQVLELDCQEPPTDGDRCMVVDSGFSVFYMGEVDNGGDDDDNGFEDMFRTEVADAVDSGALNSANDQIIDIRITDPATYRPYQGDPAIQRGPADLTPEDDSTVPIVIAAVIGSLVLLGAGAAYARSKRSASSTPA